MHRFFLPLASFQPDRVNFPVETARQMVSVLRLKVGQSVIALNNAGLEFEVELDQVDKGAVAGRVIAARPVQNEPELKLGLFIALSQREKFEWILQKCTEVGVSEFVPLVTERSLLQNAAEANRKLERWQRIIQEAAEQSGRGIIPTLHTALTLREAVFYAQKNYSLRLIPWEAEQQTSLRAALSQQNNSHVAIMIGPEGGFSEAEIQAASSAGFIPVTLGKRILRMETAAIVASALVMEGR